MDAREQSAVDTPEVVQPDAPVTLAPEATEPEAETSDTETTAPARKPLTTEEIMQAVTDLAARDGSEISADDISRLKQQFYALHNERVRICREAFVAEGGNPDDFTAEASPLEESFKNLLAQAKEKKTAYRAKVEAEMAANAERKQQIIARIEEISTDADNAGRLFPEVRELQNEFKTIGEGPQELNTELWKKYQEAVERFYDQLKINKELRDYDFRKNLTEKEALIAETEGLLKEDDVIVAFRRLQEIHNRWRGIGPVPKDVREEIWAKFRDLSAEINRRYTDFFVERKATERANEDAKTALCERLEAIDLDSLTTFAAWDKVTADVIAAQNEWRGLGFASRKVNSRLFNRFRSACDKFFAAKGAYFQKMKEEQNANLERKIALCERAEALKDSTEWRKTTEEIERLKEEWRTVGVVPKRQSDQVWRRFMAACDYFYQQRKKAGSGARRTERANLEQKNEIISRLEALEKDETLDGDKLRQQVKDLQAEWQSVGHVPFSAKDRVYSRYREVCDKIYGRLDASRRTGRRENFETTLAQMEGDRQKLYRERERLLRVYEARRAELQTFENNLGFLSGKSKNAQTMLADMQRRMQRLRDDLGDLEGKIKIIDGKL